MCLSFKILNLFGTLSPWGSGNYRPSAPFLYEVASHVKNCHFGDYYYYYYKNRIRDARRYSAEFNYTKQSLVDVAPATAGSRQRWTWEYRKRARPICTYIIVGRPQDLFKGHNVELILTDRDSARFHSSRAVFTATAVATDYEGIAKRIIHLACGVVVTARGH